MMIGCHNTCSDSGDHKGLKQDNNVRTCQGVSVSVGGGNSTNSVNSGDCPSAALQDDPAFSGSIYEVIMVSSGKMIYKADTHLHIYIHSYLECVFKNAVIILHNK